MEVLGVTAGLLVQIATHHGITYHPSGSISGRQNYVDACNALVVFNPHLSVYQATVGSVLSGI